MAEAGLIDGPEEVNTRFFSAISRQVKSFDEAISPAAAPERRYFLLADFASALRTTP